MNSQKALVYFVLFLAMIFWSFSFILSKIALDSISPVSLVLCRLVISTVFLVLLSFSLKQLVPVNKKDIPVFLLLAFFEPILYFIGDTYGLSLISPTLAAVIISTIPLFIPFAAFFIFKEKLAVFNLLGIILSVAGVAFIIIDKNFDLTASPAGIMLLFLAVFSAVGYTLVLYKLAARYNSVTIITYQNMIGVPVYLVLFFIIDFKEFSMAQFDYKLWLTIVALAIFPTSLSYMFFTMGVKKIGINKASVFTNIIPVLTAIFSWLILDEKMNFQKITGIIIVFAGLMLSQANRISFKLRPGGNEDNRSA